MVVFSILKLCIEEIAHKLRLEITLSRQKPDWTDEWCHYSDDFILEMSKAYNQSVELKTHLHRNRLGSEW